MDEPKPTPIEVNLRLPEEPNSDFSLADVIRFLWDGRKTILICTLAGILIGIAAAGIYYTANKPKVDSVVVAPTPVNTGIATAALQYVFPSAVRGLAPDGKPFIPAAVLSDEVMNRAAKILGNDAVADILGRELKIEVKSSVLQSGEVSYSGVVLTHTIDAGSEWLAFGLSGDAGVTAVIQAYIAYCQDKYGSDALIKDNVNRMLCEWEDCNNGDNNIQNLAYYEAFLVLERQYRSLLSYVSTLYEYDPNFEQDGFSLSAFYVNIQQQYEAIQVWQQETYNRLYINDMNVFTNTAPERLAWLEQEVKTLTSRYDRYVPILSASSPSDINNLGVENTADYDIAYEVRCLADRLFDYENEIAYLSKYISLLSDGADIIVDSEDMSKAAGAIENFTRDLTVIHDEGSILMNAYYTKYFADKLYLPEDMIIISQNPIFKPDAQPVVESVVGASSAPKFSQLLLLFTLCSALGLALGVVILYTQKLFSTLKVA